MVAANRPIRARSHPAYRVTPWMVCLLLVAALWVCPTAVWAQGPRAVLVVGNVSLSAADAAVAIRLDALGFEVLVVDDSKAAPSDERGAALVAISSSVRPARLDSGFRDLETPLVVWEHQLFAALGLTEGEEDTDFGRTSGETEVAIVQASHPLAAGLNGTPTTTSSPSTFAWGRPGSAAEVVATEVGNPEHATLFAYEADVIMPGLLSAPARRVALFMDGTSSAVLTAEGLALFDAAVIWASSRGVPNLRPVVAITAPVSGATFTVGESITFTAQASDADGNIASVSFQLYGISVGNATTAAPYSLRISNLPAGLYALRARAVDERGLVTVSEPSYFQVGSQAYSALLVAGNDGPTAGDQAILEHLNRLGLMVTTAVDETVTADSDTSHTVVLVSASARAGKLRSVLRDVETPVMTWDHGFYRRQQMTGPISSVDHGVEGDQAAVTLDAGNSFLAAGLQGSPLLFTHPQTLAWGVASDEAQIVATLATDDGRAALFAYQPGAAMVTAIAPARRLGFPLARNAASELSAAGWRLFETAVAWSAGFDAFANNQPPQVDLSAPADGLAVPAGEPIALAANAVDLDGSVAEVIFKANGETIATTSAEPYSATWMGAAVGRYAVTAEARDDRGAVTISSPARVEVGTPPGSVLMIVGSEPSSGDTTVAVRLQSTGYNVTQISSEAFSPADGLVASALLVSATARAGDLGRVLSNLPIPTLTWNHHLFDNLGMTGTENGVDHGRAPDQFQLEVSGGSFLAAGLSGGVGVSSAPSRFTWGMPNSEAAVVATLVGDPGRAAIFSYERGALMPGGVALARRVGFFLGTTGANSLVDNGWALFDAAMAWTAGLEPGNRPPSVSITTPAAGTEFALDETLTFSIEASDIDGTVARVEVLAAGTTIGVATASPWQVEWTASSAGVVPIAARAVDDQGAATPSAPISIVIGGASRTALLIVGESDLGAGDAAVRSHLERLGYQVAVASATDVTAAEAGEVAVVLISSTVRAREIDPAFSDLEVPIITWENRLYDDLGFTGDQANVDFGRARKQIAIDVTDGALFGQPDLAGLTGVTTRPRAMAWGLPGAAAQVVARLADGSGLATHFAYEAGSEMAVGIAPARRVALGLHNGTAAALAPAGWALFDGAIAWATGIEIAPLPDDTTPPSLAITAPVDGTIVNTSTPTITLTYDDPRSGIEATTLEVRLDGGVITSSCQVTASGATCQAIALAEGSHGLTATIADLAGNLATAEASFSVELLVPDAVSPSILVLAPHTGEILIAELPSVIVTYFDRKSGIAESSFLADLDGVALACTVGPIEASCDVTELAAGRHTLAASVQDSAGNEAAITFEFTALLARPDTSAPDLQISSPLDGTLVGDATPEIRVAYADDDSGPDLQSLLIEVDGVDLISWCQITADFAACESTTLASGSHSVVAEISDLAGNTTTVNRVFTLDLDLPVVITSPQSGLLTQASTLDVIGTVSPLADSVEVAGITAQLSEGSFEALNVPLTEGSNTLTVIARNVAGGNGLASVTLVRDTEGPRITLINPPDGFVTTSPHLIITGEVVDLTSSNTEAAVVSVEVNGLVAEVDHRSFVVPELLLQPGENSITAVARDALGNSHSTTRIIHRVIDSSARLEEISGNLQSAAVGTALAEPLVVRLTDAFGTPLIGQQITFEVTRGDGSLIDFPEAVRTFRVRTDSNGLGSANFTLGRRAGSGNHEVTASAAGRIGSVIFCASGTSRIPERIVRIAGDNAMGSQTAIAGKRFAKPLLTQVFDSYGNPVAGVTVTYQVTDGGGSFAGQATAFATTDADGKAAVFFALGPEEGVNNNRVEAAFDDGQAAPAMFQVGGQIPGPVELTSVIGVVLDNADLPVPGVTVTIAHLTTVSDAQGRFQITSTPAGRLMLEVDGATATRPGTWPHLEFELIAVSGRENQLGMPIRLLPLDDGGVRLVGGNQDVTLPIAGVAGVELTVFANSTTFPDGSSTGALSLTQVHADKVPMVAPMGSNFMLAWTVQPPGVKFDPPARIAIPNMGEAPGTVVDMFSFDHELGEFVSIGTASVSEDGSQLLSNPGSGVIKSGWHGCVPPPAPPSNLCKGGACTACAPTGPVSTCTECQHCDGPDGCEPNRIVDIQVTIEEDRDTVPEGNTPISPRRAQTRPIATPAKQATQQRTVGLNAMVSFTAKATPEGECQDPLTYEWDFGDGETDMGKTVEHRFKKRTVANDDMPFMTTVTIACPSCPDMTLDEVWEVEVEGSIEIQRVISDQLPGLTCNFLDRAAGDGPNNPMLMGCRSGSDAQIRVVTKIEPPAAEPLARIQVRRKGGTERKGENFAKQAPAETAVMFQADNGAEIYEIVAGFFENDTVGLEDEEIMNGDIFPHNVQVVTLGDYEGAAGTLEFQGAIPGTGVAGALLRAYLTGATPPRALATPRPTAASSLDHPVGILPAAGSCTDTSTFEYSFSSSTSESTEVAKTDQIEEIIREIVMPHSESIRAFFANSDSPTAIFPQATGEGPWTDSRGITWSQMNHPLLFLAFGSVRINTEVLEVEVRKFDLKVLRVRFRGNFEDAYDFAIKKFGNRNGAITQSGYSSLGQEGHVFRDSIEFERTANYSLGIFFP